MPSAEPAPAGPRPVGRPARINRQMIAEAAHEMGLDGLTLKAVADHLGVSIAALYHHVGSKDELMRVAAEYSATRVPLPEDRGQHWAVWLYEWATYNRDAFLAQPGLLGQFLEGAISPEVIAGNVDTILGLLVRQGFPVVEANAAYELVSMCAIGMSVVAIRERQAERSGRPLGDLHREMLTQSRTGELPYLRALVEEITEHGRQPFHVAIGTVLCGIALRRGEPWEPIQRLLDDAAGVTR